MLVLPSMHAVHRETKRPDPKQRGCTAIMPLSPVNVRFPEGMWNGVFWLVMHWRRPRCELHGDTARHCDRGMASASPFLLRNRDGLQAS